MDPNQQNPQQQGQPMPHHVPISQIKEHIEAQKAGNNQPINPMEFNGTSSQMVSPTPNNQENNNPSSAVNDRQLPNNDSKTGEVNTTTAQQESNVNQFEKVTDAYVTALIWLQFVSLAIILFGFIPPILWANTFLMVAGILMVAAGICVGIWAVVSFGQSIKINPKPNKNGFLVTGGPYKYQRHPMYFGLITASIGLTIAFPTIPRIIALIALIVVLNTKVGIEEKMLAVRYHHYSRYQKITGRIVPKFKKPDIELLRLDR